MNIVKDVVGSAKHADSQSDTSDQPPPRPDSNGKAHSESQGLLAPLQITSRPSSDDDGSIYSADNENERQRGRLLAPTTARYQSVSPAPARSWRAKCKALWTVNKGLALVLLSQLFDSLQYLPLAEATVITFLAPIVACWACSILINEPFTRSEQVAGLVSLLGVILIARPTSFSMSDGGSSMASGAGDGLPSANTTISAHDGNNYHVTAAQRLFAVGVALVGVFGAASAYTTIRWIGQRAHPLISVNYFAAWTTFVTTVVLLFVPGMNFRLPWGLKQWSYLIFLGCCGYVMQLLLTTGLAYEKSSRATNMVYTQMLFALAFDKLVFDTTPGTLSILGSSLILGSALYIAVQQDPSKKPTGAEGAHHDEEVGLVAHDVNSVSNEGREPLRGVQEVQLRTMRV
ncbi:MAG: hypothetical protein Q9210_001628 [Variospora velana]